MAEDHVFCRSCGREVVESTAQGISTPKSSLKMPTEGRPTNQVPPRIVATSRWSKVHKHATIWGLILFILCEALSFVKGAVEGTTQLHNLSQYQWEAYNSVMKRAELLTANLKPIFGVTLVFEISSLVLAIMAAATLFSLTNMRQTLHEVSSLVCAPLLVISKVILSVREDMATKALAEIPRNSEFGTAMDVQRRFVEATGWFASPSYTVIVAIASFVALGCLIVGAVTALKHFPSQEKNSTGTIEYGPSQPFVVTDTEEKEADVEKNRADRELLPENRITLGRVLGAALMFAICFGISEFAYWLMMGRNTTQSTMISLFAALVMAAGLLSTKPRKTTK